MSDVEDNDIVAASDILSRVRFRSVRPTDIPTCTALEKASYPTDEAASKSQLQYRQHHAAKYFRCAIIMNENGKNNSSNADDDEQNAIIGYVCSTRCKTFTTSESMATHVPDGPLLAIHSVVVAEEYRRCGIATAMLTDYIQRIQQINDEKLIQSHEQDGSNLNKGTALIKKLVLLSKPQLFLLYIHAGFRVVRPSPIVHGKETWYELDLDLTSSNDTTISSYVGGPLLKSYWVMDAFADPQQLVGTGNPAAVVPLGGIVSNNTSNNTNGDKNDANTADVVEENEAMLQWMQTVAQEFNLSETAFVWPYGDGTSQSTIASDSSHGSANLAYHYNIRYFTPRVEVPLCGHATLATSALLYQIVDFENDNERNKTTIVFHARECILTAELFSTGPLYTKITMEFPVKPAVELSDPKEARQMIVEAFKLSSTDDNDNGDESDPILFIGLSDIGDLLVELSYDAFCGLPEDPNYTALLSWPGYTRGVIVASICRPDDDLTDDDDDEEANTATKTIGLVAKPDFCSRFFGPKAGINEDPVTGSAHCVLAPYFGEKLNKDRLVGHQRSKRGGLIECELVRESSNDNEDEDDEEEEVKSVRMTGCVVTTMEGQLRM